MQGKYEGLFGDDEYETIEKEVDAHIRKWSRYFAPGDREDLIQECIWHWTTARKAFNKEGGASLRTFQKRVLDHKLCDIDREQWTDRRKINHVAVSLDEALGAEDDNRTQAELVTRDPWKKLRDAYSQADLVLALADVSKKLTPVQQEICRLFMEGGSVTQVSERLSKPRATIYDEITRIRELFENEGLRDYLN